ncbi:MAG: hypothetical protein GY810_22185 [Aureispira sp.]|nr:hypothetical protein [Aureispira sp.]
MAGGGSMKGMNDSLKNNKGLRLNHKAFSKQKENLGYGDMTPLKFKKASQERLDELAMNVKREEMRDKVANIVGVLLVITLVIAFYYLGFVKTF